MAIKKLKPDTPSQRYMSVSTFEEITVDKPYKKLTTPIKMSLEDMMSFIKDDELLEITPKSLRLRKKFLNSVERKRNSKL